MENRNKIALITGGSRGLGKDMALRLAEKGIDVILTYHTKADEAQNVVSQIEGAGQKASALQLNTGDVKSFDSFIGKLKEVLNDKFGAGHVDFLINNAGIGINAPIVSVEEEMFDELLNIHFKGVYFLTQKMLGLMNDGGGIVNVSTGLARFSLPGFSAYASMKGAIEVFTRYLAKELGSRGIKANTIAPGAIATDFSGGHLRDSEEMSNFVGSVTALGRPGMAEDIGGVVAFLCSDDAKWVNAQRIEISGGMFV
ncbi:SDR family NAD(P)-dependent oxidoreductase [Pedobacter metabolipauper]|uniref:NAD(P)-dependent dehydrogenase (Short-subunit alcohol dehydrogenase family) n=1 Tax=Pedobacter metabolipauper TaxID=425513 RepID=A0A4R6SRZ1_9SPHI|nr:SDR family oxidoreductase [Pedobacter metabolipauper]TDQ07170.1 NAD(P)-dependent dehydrogenase (short-subunit alcohol dehydrogenase family) [Pedobacter metabolipauper]